MSYIPVKALPDVVSRDQCMGCGFCQVPLTPDEASASVRMRWSPEHQHWVPEVTAPESNAVRVCPGAGMDMVSIAERQFGRQPADPMTGEVLSISAGFASAGNVRRMSASGGLTTAILTHLFETGAIDAAYCATATEGPLASSGRVITDPGQLLAATGSHYHPVDFGAELPCLLRDAGRFAFVGLPCEVAALREILERRPDVAERCVVTIGLFCGGINRYSGIGRYLEHFGVDPAAVDYIDYRYGEWPGSIYLRTRDGDTRVIPRILGNTRWRILRYMISFQGYWMLPRCRICPDQVADFADIAVGDPHLPRFRSAGGDGYSAVIARTGQGQEILKQVTDAGAVELEPMTRDELVASQGYTLENRRHANVYVGVSRALGFDPPAIRTYDELLRTSTFHQRVYASVDLLKIRVRRVRWLRHFHLPIQVFEYLFLTFSPRLVITRIRKLTSNR